MTVFGDSSYFLLFFDVVVAMISESVLRESVQRSICVSGHVAACDTAACHVAAFLLFFGVVVAFFSHSHSDIRTVFKNKRYTKNGCAVSFLC